MGMLLGSHIRMKSEKRKMKLSSHFMRYPPPIADEHRVELCPRVCVAGYIDLLSCSMTNLRLYTGIYELVQTLAGVASRGFAACRDKCSWLIWLLWFVRSPEEILFTLCWEEPEFMRPSFLALSSEEQNVLSTFHNTLAH